MSLSFLSKANWTDQEMDDTFRCPYVESQARVEFYLDHLKSLFTTTTSSSNILLDIDLLSPQDKVFFKKYVRMIFRAERENDIFDSFLSHSMWRTLAYGFADIHDLQHIIARSNDPIQSWIEYGIVSSASSYIDPTNFTAWLELFDRQPMFTIEDIVTRMKSLDSSGTRMLWKQTLSYGDFEYMDSTPSAYEHIFRGYNGLFFDSSHVEPSALYLDKDIFQVRINLDREFSGLNQKHFVLNKHPGLSMALMMYHTYPLFMKIIKFGKIKAIHSKDHLTLETALFFHNVLGSRGIALDENIRHFSTLFQSLFTGNTSMFEHYRTQIPSNTHAVRDLYISHMRSLITLCQGSLLSHVHESAALELEL